MCGIAGFVGAGDDAVLQAMSDALIHRGPDGAGRHDEPGHALHLAHRRLAILDIAEAGQRGSLKPAESYLIGVLVQSLGQRRINTVETAVDSDQTDLLSQLQTLYFRVADQGAAWEKSLGAK